MKNKVLVKIVFPEIDQSFDAFIPVNELVWRIKKLIVKSASDLTDSDIPLNGEYSLINVDTNRVYDNNEIVLNTDIRNATELLIISKK